MLCTYVYTKKNITHISKASSNKTEAKRSFIIR